MHVLQARGLSKKFGELVAVRDLNLEVNEGEVLGFLGPNGAGKTTAIHVMCGLLRPDSGEVIFGGPLAVKQGGLPRERIGICPQEIIVWGKLTCLEQLCFVGEMYGLSTSLARSRGEQLLAAMGLSDKRHKLAQTLSGGMKRRLNLIMALVHDPQLVILDEPEAGLDPQSRVLVRDYIRSMAQQKTVIFTTHNMDEADRVCDRVAIIDHGALLVADTPAALKRTVGEGDVLEVQAVNCEAACLAAAVGELGRYAVKSTAVQQSLVLRSPNILSLAAELLGCIKSQGIAVGEVKFRQNTLEDVFITLTGRRLRE